MAALYQLTNDILYLQEMMDNPEIDIQTIMDTMEGVEGEFEEKAENIAKLIRNIESDITAIKAEEKRLKSLKEKKESSIAKLKEYIKRCMALTGKRSFNTKLFSFGIRKNPASVVMDTEDIKNIPDKFLRTKNPEVDKTALQNYMKEQGITELKGICHLEQSERLSLT